MKVSVSSNYGFDHNWTLQVHDKSFYLGQDVKFCNRVLGMECRDVATAIGTREIQSEKGNLKLAKFICKQLGITKKNVSTFAPWQFAAD